MNGRHQSPVPVVTAPMPLRYKPHHCAGDSCLHDHAGDPRPRLGIFLPLLDRLTGGAA